MRAAWRACLVPSVSLVTASAVYGLYGNAALSCQPRKADEAWEIGYFTDCEGNIDYFNKFVSISRVVEYADSTKSRLKLRPGKYFVYGGDAFDKGPGDLKVGRLLVDLKQRYPSRVVLILGNRDVNKTRLIGELSDVEMRLPLDQHEGAFFQPKRGRVTPKMFLEAELRHLHGSRVVDAWSKETLEAQIERINTKANRLRFILKHTMGCPQTFEYRRRELAATRGVEVAQVSDDDVLQNFINETKEGGVVYDYLRHGQIAACIGNTLFTHGNVTSKGMGFVPGDDLKDALQDSLPGHSTVGHLTAQQWIEEVNAWAHRSLKEWMGHPSYSEDHSFRGGAALRGYCYSAVTRGCSIAVETLFQRHTNPQPMSPAVVDYLNASGIVRMVVGHKPFGNTPTVLRHRSFEAISGDTSYSDGSCVDGRGAAVSEVCIRGTPTSNYAFIHGVMPDGSRYEYALPTRSRGGAAGELHEAPDQLVGTRNKEGWLVAAKLGEGGQPQYLLRKGFPRYVVQHKVVAADAPELASCALVDEVDSPE